MKQNIVVNGGDVLEVRDASGAFLFSYDGTSSKPIPGTVDNVDVDVFTTDMMGYLEVRGIIDGWEELCNFTNHNYEISLGACIEGSTMGLALYFGDFRSVSEDVQLNELNNDMFRHFVCMVHEGAIDFRFDYSTDPLMRLFDEFICEDWSRETFNEMTFRVLSDYESNTPEKLLFKSVYDSKALSEFRELFERVMGNYLRLPEILRFDKDLCKLPRLV